MLGLSRTDGLPIVDQAHLRQSIGDILTTPIGTRVMRREYGADLPALLDAPLNDLLKMSVYSAAVSALARWEPRLQVDRCDLLPSGDRGRAVLTIDGRLVSGGRIYLEVAL